MAVAAGAAILLARGRSSTPRTETAAAKTTGASSGYCIVYPYSGAPYSSLTTFSEGASAVCRPRLAGGPIKVSGGKTRAATAASTGDNYCIEDTEENGSWHVVYSADGDIRIVKGPCTG